MFLEILRIQRRKNFIKSMLLNMLTDKQIKGYHNDRFNGGNKFIPPKFWQCESDLDENLEKKLIKEGILNPITKTPVAIKKPSLELFWHRETYSVKNFFIKEYSKQQNIKIAKYLDIKLRQILFLLYEDELEFVHGYLFLFALFFPVFVYLAVTYDRNNELISFLAFIPWGLYLIVLTQYHNSNRHLDSSKTLIFSDELEWGVRNIPPDFDEEDHRFVV